MAPTIEGKVAFIDTEWTSLHPTMGEVWEIGLIVPGDESSDLRWCCYHIEPQHIDTADPTSLNIGGYWDRFDKESRSGLDLTDGGRTIFYGPSDTNRRDAIEAFWEESAGYQLIGLTPEGDLSRLDRLVRSVGLMPRWHYQSIDVEPLMAAKLLNTPFASLARSLPWNTTRLADALGINLHGFDAHTAIGDAWAAAVIFQRIMGPLGIEAPEGVLADGFKS